MSANLDLLIIGAGPAGLSTALHLVRQDPGWAGRMRVLDGSAHPRHKLCGGGVTPFGMQILSDLGLPDPLPIPHARVEDARFVHGNRTIHYRGNPAFLVFHRKEFDHYLAREAQARGVVLCEQETVRQIEPGAQGVQVTTSRGSYQVPAVVGADGSKGLSRQVVARRAAQRSRSPQRIRVARLLEVVSPASESDSQFTEQYAIFDYSHVRQHLQGYVWDFPTRVGGAAHFSRGVYDSRVAARREKARLPGLFNQALETMGTDPDSVQIEGHPIHWFSPRNRFAIPRLLLVGDAAGAEPLFGEGIAPALGYGRVAAASIQQAFERQDFSFNDYRRHILFSSLGAYLLLRWWVAWWSYRLGGSPLFMKAMWKIGRGLAALRGV